MEPEQMPITMSGESTFNTFSYLLHVAESLAKTADEHAPGSKHCRISAVLFSAFAIEAHLNHIGEAKHPDWKNNERRMSRREKLTRLNSQFGIPLDFNKRPFQTFVDLFKFRDQLAHGKSKTEEKDYEYNGNSEDELVSLDPEWLKINSTKEAVDRALTDTRQIIELLHSKAGLDLDSMHTIGTGSFTQTASRTDLASGREAAQSKQERPKS